jgi:KDO2-lipid IV(A) lauroyltransferase
MFENIFYYIEHLLVKILLKIFRFLPIDYASAFGCFIGKYIGSLVREMRLADINLKTIFPKMSECERKNLIRKMCCNIGRNVAEFPHLHKLKGKKFEKRVKIVGIENLPKNQAFIPLTAHFGNWELFTPFSEYKKLKASVVYKKPKNRLLDDILIEYRNKNGVGVIAQGASGVREIIKRLGNGEVVGLVVDQRVEGASFIPFLGRKARTSTLPASIALKYGYSLVPMKFIRLKGAYFEIEIMKPISFTKKDSEEKITKKINDEFGKWIMDAPEQWLWANKRWSNLYKEKYNKK